MPYGIPHLIFFLICAGGGAAILWNARKPGVPIYMKRVGHAMILVGACILLWAVCSEQVMLAISGTFRDIRKPRVDEIAAISLLPHEEPEDLYGQVTKIPIRIRDRAVVGEIADALRRARPWHRSHASQQRICWLAIEYDHATRYCEVSWVEGESVLFEIVLAKRAYPALGDCLATYRNDGLGPILLRAATAYGN
jgi:hypothetical protein